ncbi:MAG: 16S rRNA (cytosine(1402)-N(4))-methyltransferase RsmH [Flavobacteriales bacterium]|nr:16S rRNA (cytosine(1402)-N(4))-methyltransferase RsmH [Flavobacteriales bacterium]
MKTRKTSGPFSPTTGEEGPEGNGYHRPAMLRETIEALAIKSNGIYVDVTFGGGGHSREILKYLDKSGKLVAFDQDPDAGKNAPDDDRLVFVGANFRYIHHWLCRLGIEKVDGILADLGVSSHQFDSPERGFSLRFEAGLDMRMDRKRPRNAADILNHYTARQLTEILATYGEVDKPARVADVLIRNRPIDTTTQLNSILESMAPAGKTHKFFAQVYQALRMEVNEELQVLQELLDQCKTILRPDGRLVVISYHSLEDRMVKHYMKSGNAEGKQERDFFGNLIRPFEPVNSKAMVPSDEEIAANNRVRSARMRVAFHTRQED